jgi:putative transcriptional regulator
MFVLKSCYILLIINVGDGLMNKLKKLRNDHGFSCGYMAEKLGVSKPFYWQIENGKRRLSYSMAVKIAKIFKKKPDDIFYDEFN